MRDPRRTRSLILRIEAIFVAGALLACGQAKQNDRSGAGGAEAFGGSLTRAGESSVSGATSASGGSGTTGASGETGAAGSDSPITQMVEPSETSDCSQRETLACDSATFAEELQSLSTPLFEPCGEAVPFDGCGRLLFDFDANGCLSRITTPVSPAERIGDHFSSLRACLKPRLDAVRFECLSDVRFQLNESCLIR